MDLNSSKELICVEYPGRVLNPDRAIQTLGGINQISEVMLNDSENDAILKLYPLPDRPSPRTRRAWP